MNSQEGKSLNPLKQRRWPIILIIVLAGLSTIILVNMWGVEGRQNAVSLPIAESGPDGAIGIPTALPDMVLATTNGESLTLKSLSGKPVIVNFWATWCPPCRREMPALESFYQRYRQEDIVVLAINAGEPLDTIVPYLEKQAISFPVALDPNLDAMSAFHVVTLPTSFFFDRKGNLVTRHSGPMEGEQIEKNALSLW